MVKGEGGLATGLVNDMEGTQRGEVEREGRRERKDALNVQMEVEV